MISLPNILAQAGATLTTLRELAPSVVGALVLVLVGWLSARLLSRWLRRLTDAVLVRTGGDLVRAQHPGMAGTIVGAISFWAVFLVFVAAAVDMLGLPVVTETLSRFVYFLPNVLAAGIILVVGTLVGDLARGAITRSLSRANATQAAKAGSLARFAIIAVALIVAIEEIGIDGQLLVILVALVVGAGLAGAGLAFGLGARTAVSNIIASHYLPDGYREGRMVKIGDIEGRIVATTPASVVIATPDAQVTIPAKYFGEKISYLITETS